MNIIIYATSNSSQNGIVITDNTDWTTVGGSLPSLTGIILNIYGTSLVTPTYSYTLTPAEEETYIETGTVEISFLTAIGLLYLNDGWYSVQMVTNTGTNISNYSGFGLYSDITFAVFDKINNLHVPEEIKYNAERYCIYAMWLKGLGFLDTTNINSREVKFQKRLVSLQKMLLNI